MNACAMVSACLKHQQGDFVPPNLEGCGTRASEDYAGAFVPLDNEGIVDGFIPLSPPDPPPYFEY